MRDAAPVLVTLRDLSRVTRVLVSKARQALPTQHHDNERAILRQIRRMCAER
jgi:hypothetical protein